MSLSGDIDTAVAAVTSGSSTAPVAESTPQPSQPSVANAVATPVGQPATGAPAVASPSSRVPGKNPKATEPSAATITPPASADPNQNPAVPESYPSQEKWPAVLDNARKKEAARVENEEYGVPLTEWKATWKPHVDALRTNPLGYYKVLGDQLRAQGLLQAEPQPATAQPTTPQTSSPSNQPQPDLRSEDGKLAYSAERTAQLVEWHLSKFEEKLGGRFKPVEEEIGTIRDTRMRTQAAETARQTIAEAETWPDFAELKPEIHRLMREDGRRTLQSAYIEASKAHRPQVTSKIREGILKELQSTPAAPTTVAPSRAAASVNGNGRPKGRGSLDATIDRELRSRLPG